jgi:HSP20 family molecular chaperone IbpA
MFPWNFSPFNKKMNSQLSPLNPNEIEKFVKEMMGQMMSGQMQGMMNTSEWTSPSNSSPAQNNGETKTNGAALSYSVCDTHNDIFVRIGIKEESWLSSLKLYLTSNQLIIEHIPNQNDKTTVTLPAIVRKKGSSTSYKDEILEVKIPKHIDMQYSEIEVLEK